MNNNTNDNQNVATAALAAATKTPFKTAFSITMGIAAAHLLVGLLFLGGCAAVLSGTAYVISKTFTVEEGN